MNKRIEKKEKECITKEYKRIKKIYIKEKKRKNRKIYQKNKKKQLESKNQICKYQCGIVKVLLYLPD